MTVGGLAGMTRSSPIPPLPPAPHVTETATVISRTMDGRDPTVNELADALDGLSITQPPATHSTATRSPPQPPSTPVSVVQRRRGRSRYYSVIVGKRCGVFSSW